MNTSTGNTATFKLECNGTKIERPLDIALLKVAYDDGKVFERSKLTFDEYCIYSVCSYLCEGVVRTAQKRTSSEIVKP